MYPQKIDLHAKYESLDAICSNHFQTGNATLSAPFLELKCPQKHNAGLEFYFGIPESLLGVKPNLCFGKRKCCETRRSIKVTHFQQNKESVDTTLSLAENVIFLELRVTQHFVLKHKLARNVRLRLLGEKYTTVMNDSHV